MHARFVFLFLFSSRIKLSAHIVNSSLFWLLCWFRFDLKTKRIASIDKYLGPKKICKTNCSEQKTNSFFFFGVCDEKKWMVFGKRNDRQRLALKVKRVRIISVLCASREKKKIYFHIETKRFNDTNVTRKKNYCSFKCLHQMYDWMTTTKKHQQP